MNGGLDCAGLPWNSSCLVRLTESPFVSSAFVACADGSHKEFWASFQPVFLRLLNIEPTRSSPSLWEQQHRWQFLKDATFPFRPFRHKKQWLDASCIDFRQGPAFARSPPAPQQPPLAPLFEQPLPRAFAVPDAQPAIDPSRINLLVQGRGAGKSFTARKLLLEQQRPVLDQIFFGRDSTLPDLELAAADREAQGLKCVLACLGGCLPLIFC